MNDTYERIDQVLITLEDELDVYDNLIAQKTKAEATYKSLKAKLHLSARLQAELKTVADKEAWCDEQLETEFYEYRLSEGKLEAHKSRIQTLRSLLNGLQTLAAASRV